MSEVLPKDTKETHKKKTHSERLEEKIRDIFLSRPKHESLARDIVGTLAESGYSFTPTSSGLGEMLRMNSDYICAYTTSEGKVWKYIGPTDD